MNKVEAPDGPAARCHAMPRHEAWLTASRLAVYALLAIAVYALVTLGGVLVARGLIRPDGQPIGTDFASFWTAARLAIEGRAALPYDTAGFAAAQRKLFGPIPFYAFFYPPSFLLLLAPLGLLSYGVALITFLALGFGLVAGAARRIVGTRAALLALLAAPACFITIGHGQNAFLVAGLLGWAMLLIGHRPIVAGLLIAGATIKPQLGLLLPVALLAGGHWRVLIGAGLGSLAFAGLAGLAFGPEIWHRFLEQSPLASATMRDGVVPWSKMVTVYAAARVVGLGALPAMTLQAIVMLAMAVAVFLVWRDRHPDRAVLRAALLLAALPLAAPVALDYDMTLLLLPLLWLAAEGRRTGFRPWEITAAALVYLLPFLARPLATHLALPIAPLVIGAFFVLLMRRWRAAGGPLGRALTRL